MTTESVAPGPAGLSETGSAGPALGKDLVHGFLLLPGDGLLLVNAAGTIIWIDRCAERSLLVDAATWLGRPLQDVWPGLVETLAEMPDQLAQGYRDQPLSGPDGAGVHALRLFRTDDGFGVGLVQPHMPVDQDSPLVQLFSRVIHTVQDALLITLAEPMASPGPIIVYANRTLAEQSGYTIEQMLGRSPRLFQGAETDQEVTRRFGEDLRLWRKASMEVLNYRQDGLSYWIDLKVAPLADADGWFTHWVSVQRDVSDRKAHQQMLLKQAFTDPLTGLINRRGLYDRLERLLLRSPANLALIFCDLDRFKEVNDRYGHGVGDSLLLELTHRLQGKLRGQDRLARLGGDEFVVLMEDLQSDDDALVLAERLRSTLKEPWFHNDEEITLSMSMGVALAHGPGRISPEELLRRADLTMYRVKESGRNGVAVYTVAMDAQVQEGVTLRQQLERALRQERLVLHCQPIVDLSSGELLGAEALLRFRGTAGALVQPDVFIPVAERSGLIVPLERWVLAQALDILCAWQHQGLSLNLAINISPQHLEEGNLAEELLSEQQRTGADLRGLTVEITETVLLQAHARAYHNLTMLKAAGVSIALDDFGTGYSSLSWLSQLPIDQVKLDRTYIAQIGRDSRCDALLRGFTQVFQELGLTVVAEGIETLEQRQALIAMGCSTGQGFLFGRPLPLADPFWHSIVQGAPLDAEGQHRATASKASADNGLASKKPGI